MTRLDLIRLNVDKWISGSLNLTQDDLLPDIIYLLDLIEQLSCQSANNT